MLIKRLRLLNFRNIADSCFEPEPAVNVLFGKNAHGKTNFLEAMWLFTGSKSFRSSRDQELIRFGKASAETRLDFFSGGRENEARLEFSPNRSASLNGIPLKSPSALNGEFRAVVFSPEHLSVIKGGPQNRRKLIDTAICQLWPKHSALLQNYTRALFQRNALLKTVNPKEDVLAVWDERLCSLGASITVARLRYALRLLKKSTEFYKGISGGTEELSFRYIDSEGNEISSDVSDLSLAAAAMRNRLQKEFLKNRRRDLETGVTAAGPHRHDIDISIGGVSSRLFASQGQQRSAALSLKIAEAAILNEQTSEPPVLFLDDVMSELDPARQQYILQNAAGWQIFISCCEPTLFTGFQGGLYKVENGTITKTSN